MTIRTNDDLSREDQTLFWEKGMFYPTFTHFEEMGEVLGPCKLSENFTLFCRENILRWREVIRNQNDPITMKHFFRSNFFEGFNGQGSGDIVSKGQIDSDIEKFIRGDALFTCMGSQNLFCDSHWSILFHILPTFGKRMKVKDEVKVEKY